MEYSLEQALGYADDPTVQEHITQRHPDWPRQEQRERELATLYFFFENGLLDDLSRQFLINPYFIEYYKNPNLPLIVVKKRINRNNECVKLFKEISLYLSLPKGFDSSGRAQYDPKDAQRVNSFESVSTILSGLSFLIYDGNIFKVVKAPVIRSASPFYSVVPVQSHQKIKGIGATTISILNDYFSKIHEIEAYLDAGTSIESIIEHYQLHIGPNGTMIGCLDEERVQELRNKRYARPLPDYLIQLILERKDAMHSITDLTRIFGIGRVKAANLLSQGITSVAMLQQAQAAGMVELTDAQRLGLKYVEDLQERIPRSEIERFKIIFHNLFDQYGIVWEITGSYRRNEETSGDIDLIVKEGQIEGQTITMNTIIELIVKTNRLLGSLAFGERKFMGIINGTKPRRIDVRLFSDESWAYALLYNTGSDTFNILCRNRAIAMSMTLNEYALINACGIKYPARIEADIFSYLGLQYLAPVDRRRDLITLATL